MSDPAPRLPARPSLDQLRKQAKELLRAVQAAADAAVRRVRAVVPRLDDPALATLADAQFVIAREHGFESWAKLVHHIEATFPPGMTKYDQLADEVARAYIAGDAMAIRNVNWTHGTSFVWDHEPERMRRRLATWHQSVSRDATLALDDARHLVAKQSGFDSWEELVRNVASQAKPAADGARQLPTSASHYRVDEKNGTIEVRGPIAERDWDSVLAVMKELRLTALHGAGQISDAALERLSRLDHVTSLELGGARQLTHAGLRHLSRLPLRDLQLGGWGTQVDDEALDVLRHLPELRTFSLAWAQRVSDAGVSNLAGCMHLESVNLMGTPTGDGTLRALTGKPRLSAVDAGTRVTPGGLALLHDFPVFSSRLPDAVAQQARASDTEPTHLTLYPAAFVHGGLDAVAGLDGIFSLRLFGLDRSVRPITGAALRPVVGLRGLESLWCDPSDDAMAVIASMSRLRKLMCQDTDASDDGWVALSRSTSIESIWGRKNRGLADRGLVAMSAMPAMRTLGVNLARASEAALASLPSFPALRHLTPIGLGDAAFAHVGRCANLETLTCMYTADVGDGATEHIAGLRRLQKYYAGDTSITDHSLEILGALPSLESVELWSCTAVTDAGVAALGRAPRLREVVLDGLPLVTRAAATLVPSHVSVRIQ